MCRAAGCILLTISVLMCLIPFFAKSPAEGTKYRSGECQNRGISLAETTINGEIRVNLDGPEKLTELPGIGPSLAKMIVEERETNGPFRYAEDLESVRGIGSGTVEKIRNMIDLSLGESGE